jgi:hypothetical protein
LVTVAPADTLELIDVGVGLGVGEGVADGVGVGVGGACASDGEDTTAIARTRPKTMAMPLDGRRPAPAPLARKSRREQPINAIPKRSTTRQKPEKNPSTSADLPPVLRERQSVMAVSAERLADIVVPRPQRIGGESSAARFPEPRQKLANAQISCCNIGTIGFRPFDCAFRD